MTDAPTTKAETVALIHERWAALQALVGRLSDAEMERPLADGWSAKVHMGHLAAWEKSLMGLLRKQDRPSVMGISHELWDGHDADAINRVIAERTAALSLVAVRTESNSTHQEMLALLDSMSEADLDKPYSFYQPQDLPETAAPVGGWVHGNTWDHYNEHIGWLEVGLAP
jgi:hypothetical protein